MDALLLHHTHLFCMCAIVCCMGCKQDASICFTWGLLSLIASGTNASGWSDFKDLPGAGNCNHSDYQFGLVCWASCLDRLFLPALVPLLRSCLMLSEHTHARTRTRTLSLSLSLSHFAWCSFLPCAPLQLWCRGIASGLITREYKPRTRKLNQAREAPALRLF